MPYKRKNPPILNETDLIVKRLIERMPCAIADITYITGLTTQQVKAILEKLEARNDCFPFLLTHENTKRNIYFPTLPIDRKQLAAIKRAIPINLTKHWEQADSPELKVMLMHEVDKRFRILYNGVAGLANMRKDAE